MNVGPMNAGGLPAEDAPLGRDALHATWLKLERRHQRVRERGLGDLEWSDERDLASLEWSDEEVGALLAEVERLRRSARAPSEGTVAAPRAYMASLELLARTVRDAQVRWSSTRFGTRERLQAYDDVLSALGLVERLRQAAPFGGFLGLAVDELRRMAAEGSRP